MIEDFPVDDGFVLIDFFADWCEPCKWVVPVIGDVQKNLNNQFKIEKSNIDDHPEIAKAFHILSVPTLILFHNKKEIWRMRGFDTVPNLTREFEKIMSSIQ